MRTWSFILLFCSAFLLEENCVAQVPFDYSFFQFLLKENAISSAAKYINSFEKTDSILYCQQLLALQSPAPSLHADFLPTFSNNNLLQQKTAALSYYNTHKTNNRQFSNKNSIDIHYIYFFQACIAADQEAFDRFKTLFSQHKKLDSLYTNLALEEAWNALEETAASHTAYQAKSKYTAGLLSMVVPGLGKAYLGKKRQALSTFTGIALLSMEAWEAYEKGGPTSPLFIGFGSLTALFYLGNIYGTLRLNKASRSKQNRYYHEKIMAIMGPMLVE